jgi:two-component system, OmpR family, alkaline phosphatase synthesis response regulator PhoP
MARVLIVEDEPDLAMGLRVSFEADGHTVTVAHTGTDGYRRAVESPQPDLMILDLMLPDVDGYEVLRRVRRDGLDTPVILLTARGEETDRVRGFRTGADDYVTKPFGVMELLLRVRAMLRRGVHHSAASMVPSTIERFGTVEVDLTGRVVRRDGRDVILTLKAFELLVALLHSADRTVTRQDLLRNVWGYGSDVVSRTIDAHIAELRRKLEIDPANPRHIITVQKVGYRLRRHSE